MQLARQVQSPTYILHNKFMKRSGALPDFREFCYVSKKRQIDEPNYLSINMLQQEPAVAFRAEMYKSEGNCSGDFI